MVVKPWASLTPPVSEVTMMNLCDGPSKVSEHGGEWSVFGVWNSQSNQHDAFTRPNFGVDHQSELPVHRVRCRDELRVRSRVVLADATL